LVFSTGSFTLNSGGTLEIGDDNDIAAAEMFLR
jgi:hypothetical protein